MDKQENTADHQPAASGLRQYQGAGFTPTEKAGMRMKQKIECPECSSQLKVWIDIDADISFHVSRL